MKEGQQRVRVTQVRSRSSHPHGQEGGGCLGLQRSRSQGTSHPRLLGAAEGSGGDIPCGFILYVSMHTCVCVSLSNLTVVHKSGCVISKHMRLGTITATLERAEYIPRLF